jgi:hypothetical protein
VQEQLRDDPLTSLTAPVLFVRGSNDSFCNRGVFDAVRERMASEVVQATFFLLQLLLLLETQSLICAIALEGKLMWSSSSFQALSMTCWRLPAFIKLIFLSIYVKLYSHAWHCLMFARYTLWSPVTTLSKLGEGRMQQLPQWQLPLQLHWNLHKALRERMLLKEHHISLYALKT